ncbi:hypothetical protein GCM10022403_035290 [Streptomyces coacervatus]|uniref:Uncharacterized protein n=1 Tax=Streptomyces coacervatus TaxID=647381 RepID=A0ABP7HU84_9ACTN
MTPDSPKPGGSWFQVQPEVATKMIAASTSRSPRRRCPPPCGRTGAGGTTRWNNFHNSSGAIRSTSASVITPDCRKITPTEMASKRLVSAQANLPGEGGLVHAALPPVWLAAAATAA